MIWIFIHKWFIDFKIKFNIFYFYYSSFILKMKKKNNYHIFRTPEICLPFSIADPSVAEWSNLLLSFINEKKTWNGSCGIEIESQSNDLPFVINFITFFISNFFLELANQKKTVLEKVSFGIFRHYFSLKFVRPIPGFGQIFHNLVVAKCGHGISSLCEISTGNLVRLGPLNAHI